MNQELINEIRSKLNIVDVISSYIPLSKKGRNYFGVCPFHDDHNPSLSVSSEKQIYKCFVCGESGNVFNFVMNYEHIPFLEAVRKLGSNIGIDVGVSEHIDKNQKYYDMMDIANKFFQNNLLSKEGKLAREYLEKRQLSKEIIEEFGIGLSLNKKDVLTNLLMSKGHALADLNLIDLANTNRDSYINRIMFPLQNKDGKVIGFSGRIYDNSDLNKYQNTKETPIFKKRENLFNYHRAKEEIRKSKSVIVMEGFMAVIRAYTIGVRNVIATMGTALSNEQADLIKRLSPNIYLCYDGDDAGRKATLSSGEVFTKMNCNVLVIPLTDKLDPDDYILKFGEEKFKDLIRDAIPFSEYKIKTLKKNFNLDNIDDKTNYINSVLLEIKKTPDEIKREIMLKRLASDTNIWYNTLEKKLLELDDNTKKEVKKEELTIKKDRKSGYQKTMEALIYYSLNNPSAITIIENSNVYLPDNNIRLLMNEIIAYYHQYSNINEADFCTYINQKNNNDLILLLKKILSSDYPSNMMEDDINSCLVAIKNYNIALEIKKLEKELKEETNLDRQISLMEEIRVLKTKEGKSW